MELNHHQLLNVTLGEAEHESPNVVLASQLVNGNVENG